MCTTVFGMIPYQPSCMVYITNDVAMQKKTLAVITVRNIYSACCNYCHNNCMQRAGVVESRVWHPEIWKFRTIICLGGFIRIGLLTLCSVSIP